MAMAVVTHASQEGSGGAAVSFTTGAGNLVLDSAVSIVYFLFFFYALLMQKPYLTRVFTCVPVSLQALLS